MVLKFEELSWKELDAMDRQRTLFFLPVSPLEEHGPHLPLGVDFINADLLAHETAEMLAARHPDWQFILCPALAVGAHVIKYVGSISIRQRVIRDLLIDYGSSIARYGFKYIVVMNAHGAPGHLVALEEACEAVNRRFGIQMVSPTGRITFKLLVGDYYERLARYLPEDVAAKMRHDARQDYHAGLWETSMMLLFRPDLVKDGYKNLAPVLKQAWEVLGNAERAARAEGGYLGTPGSASVAYARASTRVMRDEFLALLERMMAGQDIRRELKTLYSWIPFLWTDFWTNAAILAGVMSVAAGMAGAMRCLLRGAQPRATHGAVHDPEPSDREEPEKRQDPRSSAA